MTPKKKILVTGANGQLGRCIKDASTHYPEFEFVFVAKEALDILEKSPIATLFQENQFTHCINTAAYTNVEKAESEPEKTFAINSEAVKNLAEVCRKHDTVLLHISTDYVFDGKNEFPYVETDPTNPLNVYGASKLKGEQYIEEICDKYFIFRTSWLYSQYGHNFLKTILKYSKEDKQLTITTEQRGTPTNANDLAQALLSTIAQDSTDYGVYHFSNSGETTWYGFAKEILLQTGRLNDAKLAETNHYATFAERPIYSVLNNKKIGLNLNVPGINWEKGLKSVLKMT